MMRVIRAVVSAFLTLVTWRTTCRDACLVSLENLDDMDGSASPDLDDMDGSASPDLDDMDGSASPDLSPFPRGSMRAPLMLVA